jgi:hypothetical protein
VTYFEEIQKLIVDRLVALNIAGGNVNEAKTIPEDEDALPAVNVYAMTGRGKRPVDNAPFYNCELTVQIDAFATGATDTLLSTAILGLCYAVIAAVKTDVALAKRFKIRDYEFNADFSIEGRTRMSGAQIKFTGTYDSDEDYTFTAELEKIHVTVKHDGKTEAEIDYDIPETP